MAEPGRVIDGDTFEAKINIWLNIYYFDTIRILDINAPERKTGQPYLDAKIFTQNWLKRGDVVLKACKRDDFGRLLAEVSRGEGDNKEILAQELIKSKNAVPFIKK